MGTNYYCTTKEIYNNFIKSKEDYFDFRNSYHIGKRSCGWVFSFQSHNIEILESVDNNLDKIILYTLDTKKSWFKFLNINSNYIILDEFSQLITLSSFKDIVENSIIEPRSYITLAIDAEKRQETWIKDYWIDSEGYTFTTFDFS